MVQEAKSAVNNLVHIYIHDVSRLMLNKLNDVSSMFKVRVYYPSLAARSACGNIAEELMARKF